MPLLVAILCSGRSQVGGASFNPPGRCSRTTVGPVHAPLSLGY